MDFFFFDLDGTLEDSSEDMINAVHEVRKQLKLAKKESNEIKSYINKGMTELYVNCFSDYIIGDNKLNLLETVKEKYEACYLKNICVETKLYEGICDILKILSAKNKIFVITNKPEQHSRELIKQLKINDYITDVMGGDSCAEMKPSALPVKLIAEKYHFNSALNRAFMIGDSAGDIICGKNFGAVTIWCAWGYNAHHGTEKPNFIARLPKDILSLV